MPPPGIASSEASNLDYHVPTQQAPLPEAKQRPSSWDSTFEAEMSSFIYSATSQDVQQLEEVPMEMAWRLFLGEVGSVCSAESSPSRGSVTTEDLEWLDTQRRARAHRYSYLTHVGGLTDEQVARRDLARRARARHNAYLTLVGGLSTEELKRQKIERRDRALEYGYLQLGRLTDDELVHRDLWRRDRARSAAYMKLIGELQ